MNRLFNTRKVIWQDDMYVEVPEVDEYAITLDDVSDQDSEDDN